MTKRDIVVIGGSAGAIKALMALFANLQDDLAAAVFIVLHTSPDSPRMMPEILSRNSRLRIYYAADGQSFERGVIYVAPPDRHMLVDADGVIHLTRGTKENRFRPAIDPLFRSAALHFGPRVAGILLSGGLDDGVSGLAAVKAAGGVAIVQDPNEAEVSSIPRSAVRHVDVDWILPAAGIAALLVSLPQGDAAPADVRLPLSDSQKKHLEIEVALAEGKEGLRGDNVMELGNASVFTCPECHGTLLDLKGDGVQRFRCHTGHAYTASSLLTILHERIEETLWNSVRAIEESAMLLNHMASHDTSGEATRRQFHEAAEAALDRAKAVRTIITEGQPSVLEPPRAAE